jgi:protein-disulfide isomerase
VVKKKPAKSSRGFYLLLAIIIMGGGVWIATKAAQPKAAPVQEVDVTAAAAEGYVAGNPNAPVQVLEFADYECPACGQFSLVTEPDIRRRLIQSGLVSYHYYDFPLPQHRNSLQASIAAACADDQKKFWEMHDALFFNQPEWSTAATSNPMKFFTEYAKLIGLNLDVWKKCVEEQQHLTRIYGNRKEGDRIGVSQTPTFVIGRRKVAGAIGYDEFKAYVDSAAALPPAPAPGGPKATKKP